MDDDGRNGDLHWPTAVFTVSSCKSQKNRRTFICSGLRSRLFLGDYSGAFISVLRVKIRGSIKRAYFDSCLLLLLHFRNLSYKLRGCLAGLIRAFIDS